MTCRTLTTVYHFVVKLQWKELQPSMFLSKQKKPYYTAVQMLHVQATYASFFFFFLQQQQTLFYCMLMLGQGHWHCWSSWGEKKKKTLFTVLSYRAYCSKTSTYQCTKISFLSICLAGHVPYLEYPAKVLFIHAMYSYMNELVFFSMVFLFYYGYK